MINRSIVFIPEQSRGGPAEGSQSDDSPFELFEVLMPDITPGMKKDDDLSIFGIDG